MADYIVTSGELTTVADAIREKNGTSGNLSWPNGFVEGISSGGGSWQTVFEGSVTTEESPRGAMATLEGYSVSADTIKVTFNGTEYECNKQVVEGNTYYGDMAFSEYPFIIAPFTEEGTNFLNIITETAGTYTLKIEEPQSGGSSDFSTAEVTVNGVGAFFAEVASLKENGLSGSCFKSPLENSFTVVLYQGSTIMEEVDGTPAFTIPEGETNIVADEDNGYYLITGDCTINLVGDDVH